MSPGGWHPRRLLAAPHRLAFFGGGLALAGTAAWWLGVLAARAAGIALPWTVPPPLAHGLVMALSFMPLFITGFLFTAGPRWLAVPPVPARALLLPVALLLGGSVLFVTGAHTGASLAAAGIGAAGAGWTMVARRFWRMVAASGTADRLHGRALGAAAGVGVAAFALATMALALRRGDLASAAAQLALWGFLTPVFVTASHRMLPFFAHGAAPALQAVHARQPNALLFATLSVLALGAAAAVARALSLPGLGAPASPAGAAAPTRAADAVALPATIVAVSQAVVGAWLAAVAWRWRRAPGQRQRLPTMLRGGLTWLGVALLLAAASHALDRSLGLGSSLGLAPLHALTLGYMGSTLFAMVSRVATGHSGHPVAADGPAWTLFWVVQAAALLRLASALATAPAVSANTGSAAAPALTAGLLLAAAAAWSAACTGWAFRYGRWFGRARADGRPG